MLIIRNIIGWGFSATPKHDMSGWSRVNKKKVTFFTNSPKDDYVSHQQLLHFNDFPNSREILPTFPGERMDAPRAMMYLY